jgi:hypothetical protein
MMSIEGYREDDGTRRARAVSERHRDSEGDGRDRVETTGNGHDLGHGGLGDAVAAASGEGNCGTDADVRMLPRSAGSCKSAS